MRAGARGAAVVAAALVAVLAPITRAADAAERVVPATGCVFVAGDTELDIDQLGRVLFRELATDRARDLVTFRGGVCLELGPVAVWVEAASMVVRSPGPEAVVEAERATVHAGEWTLVADRLQLDAEVGLLTGVVLQGAGLVGRAEELALDVGGREMRALGLEVVTPTVRLSADGGRFGADDVLTLDRAVASTCPCPPATAPIRVEAGAAALDLRSQVLRVDDGVLVLEGLRLSLPTELELTEEDLATLDLPLTVGVVAEGGRGWVVGLAPREDAGVRGSADVALGGAADPRWRVAIAAEEPAASLTASARDGGLAVAFANRVRLAPELDLVLGQRLEAGAVRAPVLDTSAALAYRSVHRPAAGAIATVELQAGALAALTVQRRDGVDVAHPRGRLTASTVLATAPGRSGTLTVRVEAGATAYAGDAARQLWVGVAPRWRATFGALSVDLRHTARLVAGDSPFDERVDRVDPAALTELHLVAVAPPAGSAGVRAALEARYDARVDPLRPGARIGVQRLRVDLTVVGGTRRGWAEGPGIGWEASLLVEAAGIVDPRAERDAFVRAGLDVVGLPFGALDSGGPDSGGLATGGEFLIAAEYGLGALRSGMRSLTVGGAVPVALSERVRLTPYLAIDVWPPLVGVGGPVVRGHGAELRWDTCCGTLDLGYRSHPDGSVTTRLAFEVVPSVPSLAALEDR